MRGHVARASGDSRHFDVGPQVRIDCSLSYQLVSELGDFSWDALGHVMFSVGVVSPSLCDQVPRHDEDLATLEEGAGSDLWVLCVLCVTCLMAVALRTGTQLG